MSTKPKTAYIASATDQNGRKLHHREDCFTLENATPRATDPTVHPGREWCRVCDPEDDVLSRAPDYGACPWCGVELSHPLAIHLEHEH